LKIMKDDEMLQAAANAIYEVVLESFARMEETN